MKGGQRETRTERRNELDTLRYPELDPLDRELVDAARGATAAAYAPYSGVCVGAALRTVKGEVVTAANVENAAYGATICAERLAVGRANATGARAFAAIAIAATGDGLPVDQPVSPCGSCRQVLHELAAATGSRTRVLITTPGTDQVIVAGLDELLPLPFHAFTR
jgi:cytidine deaminase